LGTTQNVLGAVLVAGLIGIVARVYRLEVIGLALVVAAVIMTALFKVLVRRTAVAETAAQG
jgi:hypothetical protein